MDKIRRKYTFFPIDVSVKLLLVSLITKVLRLGPSVLSVHVHACTSTLPRALRSIVHITFKTKYNLGLLHREKACAFCAQMIMGVSIL